MFAGYMSSEEIMQHIVETVEDIAIQCQDCFDGVEEPVAEYKEDAEVGSSNALEKRSYRKVDSSMLSSSAK